MPAFMFGLGLRLWGIGFGLPDLFHSDEPAYVLQALAIAARLPNGLTFANPPLFKYLLLGGYVVDYGLHRLLGIGASPQDFVAQFRADPGELYLIARVSSAVIGAATAIAAFALGVAVGGHRLGAIAAWLVALAYLLVRDSHFGVDDALVTLLVTIGLVFCVRIARGGTRRDYAAGGALAGLAFAAKYDGIALLAPLILGHLLRRSGRQLSNLGLGMATCVIAALVAFPSLLIEPGRVLEDVYLHLYLGATGGYDGLDPAGGYVFYGKSLVIGLGWPLVSAVAAGLLITALRRDRSLLVVAALPVSMIVVLGAQHMYLERFLLTTLPALLVAVPTLVDAVRFDVLLTREDTRRQATEWVAAQLPADAVLTTDAALLDPPVAANQGRSIEYVITSSFTSEVRAIDPEREARRRAIYARLDHDAAVLAQFRPYTGSSPPPFMYDQIYGPFNALDELERPGPTVTVYRLNAGPGTPP